MKKLINIILFSILFQNIFCQEVQISFDNEGKLQYIDNKIDKKLNYFNDYKGFREALLFQTSDSTYLLEITYQPELKTLRERKTLSQAQLINLRAQIKETLSKKAPEYSIDQEGRTTLVVASSASGVIFYGPAMTTAFNLDGRVAVATYMFTAAASFGVPFYLTRKEPVSVASAWMSIYGQSRGIIHGFALSSLLGYNDERASFGTAIITSLVEGTAGYFYARNNKITAGQSAAIQFYGDIGSVVGILAVGSTGVFDHNSNSDKLIAGTYLASNAASLLYGRYISRNYNYETGDSYLFATTSGLGALTGLTVIDYFGPSDYKFYTASAAIGALSGMYLGHFYAKINDYSFGQGILTTCGTVAFALAGFGVGYIASETPDSKLLFTTTSLGGWGGFYLMKSIFDASNKKVALNPINLRMNIGAMPVFGFNSNYSNSFGVKKIVPALNLNYTF